MKKPIALIIEDDPRLNEIISITLDGDFEIETCADGSTALEYLRNQTPSIVILDLNLPDTPGSDILNHIRSEPRMKNTRVILATADERQAETLADNADIVLLKPVSPTQLKELALRISR